MSKKLREINFFQTLFYALIFRQIFFPDIWLIKCENTSVFGSVGFSKEFQGFNQLILKLHSNLLYAGISNLFLNLNIDDWLSFFEKRKNG